MSDESNLILDDATEKMQRTVEHLKEALLGIRAGKANQHVLKGITVDYYGSPTPVEQVASITIPDAKTILVQPWERNMIAPIEKAIIDSPVGIMPTNNGEVIIIAIPPLMLIV